MTNTFNRREAMKTIAVASATAMLPRTVLGEGGSLEVAGQRVELQIISVSPQTVRLMLAPIQGSSAGPIPDDGSLVKAHWGAAAAVIRNAKATTVKWGELKIKVSFDPLAFAVLDNAGAEIQRITVDQKSGNLGFRTGDSPLFGLGEGGSQFDRRGSVDRMKSGQGGYKLATHGGRVPIPWIISTEGWAMFFHQPYGAFDFTGPESKFQPIHPEKPLPLDLFFIASQEPAVIMAEYARLTGHPELPPLWSLGYQQSHRTLASREEVLAEARTFREKKLPCDALVYLGTGFCPSGWNTENGSFAWNQKVFSDPEEMI
jgi:alpha-glucosidase/alpha-D-xyloside xylohydrolase